MRKIKFVIFLLCFLIPVRVFSLDTLSIKYFPLHVGDFYIYDVSGEGVGDVSVNRVKSLILKDTVVNNHRYYYCTNFPRSNYNGWLRADSITGSLYKFAPSVTCPYYFQEILVDSMAALVNDITLNCAETGYTCSLIDSSTLFGIRNIRKKFSMDYSSPTSSGYHYKFFVKNIGLTYYYRYWVIIGIGGPHSGYINLIGCKINNVIYGDTTTVITKIDNTIPSSFSLSQNYPNPFNPTTTISYKVKSYQVIKLTVYNILGKEVAVLVNEKQAPGEYEVQFPNNSIISNQFPSGVYFCRLETGDFIKTIKMLLIK